MCQTGVFQRAANMHTKYYECDTSRSIPCRETVLQCLYMEHQRTNRPQAVKIADLLR
ncbi:hypothetical protein Mal52_30090 [Symmachiella dynata]|uniref:Uncharacterized protein n=1 Tax=Symmachiella dynata TaxID=2527995 RepID=A0A517ZPV8_9PLAN|nr:hypothetical protein Mal52_30090 [Symmachiella dynata]